MRKPFIVLSLAAGLTLSGAVAGTAAAAPVKAAAKGPSRVVVHRAPFQLAGTVQAVDAVAGKVTVAWGTTSADVVVPRGAAVTVDRRGAALAVVPVGAQVTVTGTVAGGVRTASRLAIVTTWKFGAEGTVGAVDVDGSTLTVDRAGTTTTLNVAADAKVEIDEAEDVDEVAATLADVPVGARVRVNGTVTNGVPSATKLVVTTQWELRVDGTAAAVDLDASSLVVRVAGAERTVPVDPAAEVLVDEVAATLADVPVGARVRVNGTVTNGVPSATKLVVTTQWAFHLDGTVAAVDADAATVTVKGAAGNTVLDVDPAAVVTLNGAPVALGSLPLGAAVRVNGTVTNSVASATKVAVTKPKPAPKRVVKPQPRRR